MTVSFQRLLLIILSIILLVSSVLLILFNSKENLIFFYTPTELIKSNIKINEKIRIGGFVKKNSIIIKNNNINNFIISDNNNLLKVSYQGVLPDLFREEQGVVIEGILLENNTVQATNVFAKHDENYIPEQIKGELEKSGYSVKKNK